MFIVDTIVDGSKLTKISVKGKERELLEFSNKKHVIVTHKRGFYYRSRRLLRLLKSLHCTDEDFTVRADLGITSITYIVKCKGVTVSKRTKKFETPIDDYGSGDSILGVIEFLKELKAFVLNIEDDIRNWDKSKTFITTKYEI